MEDIKDLTGLTIEVLSTSNMRCVGKVYQVMKKKGIVLSDGFSFLLSFVRLPCFFCVSFGTVCYIFLSNPCFL